MNRLGVLLAAIWLGLVGVGACSSDAPAGGAAASADGGTGPVRVVRVEEVRAALKPLVDAECKWLFQCCNADERADQLGPAPTATDCADRIFQAEMLMYGYYALPVKETTRTLLRELVRLGYGFDYGRVTINAAAVQACAQSISAAACNKAPAKDHCEPMKPPPDDLCDTSKLLVGKQQVGDECDATVVDCAPGLLCKYLDGNRGVCLKAPQMGDTCFADQDCEGLVCDWASGKCVKGADYDAACSYANPDRPELGTEKLRCRSSLQCDTVTLKCSDPTCAGGSNCRVDANCPAGTTCVNFRCGKPVKGGGQCNKDSDCEVGKCRYDQIVMRQLCAAPLVDGAVCNQDEDCASHYCHFKGQEGGACTPQQPLDAPCPTAQGNECVSGKCGAGAMGGLICLKGPAVGDACLGDQECNPQSKLFCVAKKCAKAPFDNAADCTAPQQCKSEVCVDSKCAAKGQEGASCGTAKTAPCDVAFYCEATADGSTSGTCKAKKPEGALCATANECFADCRGSRGQLRCLGTGGGQAHCGG